MSLKAMPLFENFAVPEQADFGPRSDQVELWSPELEGTNAQGATVIDIYDTIGGDMFFGGGVTSRQIALQLKDAGDVEVNINSPGGLFSEGNAIYNLFVQHKGKVTMNVIGRAASAAALILMAGDVVNMAPSSFMFIHNAQVLAQGDRHDFAALIADLAKLDEAIANIYTARAKVGKRQVVSWLDEETTFSAKEAINAGFADALLEPGMVTTSTARNDAKEVHALRYADAVLAEKGKSRAQRRVLLSAIKQGKPCAALSAMQDAGLDALGDSLRELLAKL